MTDSAILSQLRQEQKRWGIEWNEAERRIVVPQRVRREAISDSLRAIAKQKYCQFSDRETSEGTKIVLSLGVARFQTLLLVDKPPKAQKGVAIAPVTVAPQVAIVIDDVASDLRIMDRFASLRVPLTFAILPQTKHSAALANKAKQLNFPVILHLPMEPLDVEHNDPGRAALFLKMGPAELKDQFEKDVASVPHIQGINNHMGSAFTSDKKKMALVMKWVKERNLFFLDSHTTGKSVVQQAARKAGVPCLVNEVFLDNVDEVADIEEQLDVALRLAQKRGKTIAIGHYRRKHLSEALRRKLPAFRAQGVTLVGLPDLYPPHL